MDIKHFVALFDESHNSVKKQSKMDLQISAADICLKFEKCLCQI